MTGSAPTTTASSRDADERLAGLVRLARSMVNARSLAELSERAGEEARFAFDARTVSVSELERERGVARVLVNVGVLADGEARFPVDETYRIADFPLLAAMVEEAQPWVLSLGQPDADEAESHLLEVLGATSALAAPILYEGRIWGELFCTRAADRPPFTGDDLPFAQAFAGMMAAGLAQVEHLARVERLAYEDVLTGLGNRRLVEERLEAALAQHAVGGPPVSVVMADVNRLKAANDAFGHEAGDRALIAVAGALSVATGKVPGAVAGRMGGDEFCAVLPGYGLDVGEALARAFLRGAADAPYGVGVACGVASTEQFPETPTPSRLFALADEAQYAAKRAGSDLPLVADPSGGWDRRVFRGRADDAALLSLALDAVATGPGSAEHPPVDRLGVLADTLTVALGAAGFVVSRVHAGAAVPVLHDARRPGVLATVSVPLPADRLSEAHARGLVVDDDDDEFPLAAVRGCERVVLAGAGEWLVELLCDRSTFLGDAAAVLRAGAASVLAD